MLNSRPALSLQNYYTGYAEPSLQSCEKALLNLQVAAPYAALRAVYSKYSQAQYLWVSDVSAIATVFVFSYINESLPHCPVESSSNPSA